MTIRIERVLIAALIPLLGACASSQTLKDPAYAPTLPPMVMPPAQTQVTGSIYQANTSLHLFEDIKARRVGDLITVILKENTSASKKADTNTNKTNEIEMASPELFGQEVKVNGNPLLSASVDSDVTFSGKGASSQSNSLSGDITVTVAGVYPNGNLLIRGEKLLTLNQGSEVVRIAGIVRPVDVTPENTVYSTQIANAEITYSGNGIVADSNNAGWLMRFFNLAWFPI